ncbi:hypothetical protein DFJ73DRAFT_757038 [Zopfochytrium polystomum]|nr:hypothetical protein DFJ73DRAFT_757038 [Zopfochytrium polystomum]
MTQVEQAFSKLEKRKLQWWPNDWVLQPRLAEAERAFRALCGQRNWRRTLKRPSRAGASFANCGKTSKKPAGAEQRSGSPLRGTLLSKGFMQKATMNIYPNWRRI